MAGRKPKFPGHETRPTTLRLPLDVSEAILGDQTTRDRATDAVVREVRREYSSEGGKGRKKKAPKG